MNSNISNNNEFTINKNKLNTNTIHFSEEDQIKATSFIQKLKNSKDKLSLIHELESIFSQNKLLGEYIYTQLLHNNNLEIRKFALIFYQKTRILHLLSFIKNLILIEDNIENLNLCLTLLSKSITRTELQPLLYNAISLKGTRQQLIIDFLKKECINLNIDFNRLLENVQNLKEQEKKKRLERYSPKTETNKELSYKSFTNFVTKTKLVLIVITSLIIIIGIKAFSYYQNTFLLKKALLEIDNGNETQAESILLNLLSKDFNNLEALYYLHRLYCENYMIIEANKILSQLIMKFPQNKFSLIAEARNAIFSGDLKNAQNLINKLLTLYKEDDDVILLKIRLDYILTNKQKFNEISVYESMLLELNKLLSKKNSGLMPYIIALYITISAEAKKFNEAKEYYLKSLKTLGVNDFKIQLACAYYAEKSNNFEQALTLYENAINSKNVPIPVLIFAIKAYGRISLILNKPLQALEYYLKLQTLNLLDEETYLGLIETYGELNNITELNITYKQAIEKFSNSFMIHYCYGIAKMKNNEFDEAKSAFNKALTINPNFAATYYNIGRCTFELTNKVQVNTAPWNQLIFETKQYYQKCIEIDPTFYEAYISLGNLALIKTPPDYKEAETNFKNALKYKSDCKEALLNLLMISKLTNNKESEKEYFENIKLNFLNDEDVIHKLKNLGYQIN